MNDGSPRKALMPHQEMTSINSDITDAAASDSCRLGKLSPTRILYRNEHFIAINKPHDVRMDGDFDETIEKLLISTIQGTTKSNFKWIHQLDFATSGGKGSKYKYYISLKQFQNVSDL